MEVWKMIFLFNRVIFRFHVNFQGCISPSLCFIAPGTIGTSKNRPLLAKLRQLPPHGHRTCGLLGRATTLRISSSFLGENFKQISQTKESAGNSKQTLFFFLGGSLRTKNRFSFFCFPLSLLIFIQKILCIKVTPSGNSPFCLFFAGFVQ